jgi:hypothetical protein
LPFAPARSPLRVARRGALLNGSNRIIRLGRPNDVVMSPDARFVYAVAAANRAARGKTRAAASERSWALLAPLYARLRRKRTARAS